MSLIKSTTSGNGFKFGGIASSEDADEEGDVILRKHLDVSYISRRGYVNWDHSKAIEHQLGYTTKVEVIKPSDVSRFEDMLQVPLTKSASLYVEGAFYEHSPKAMQVYDLLKSIPPGTEGSLGLSVEGGVLRSDQGVVKALIRGVAITPSPAQPDTLCRLMKSLSLDVNSSVEGVVVETLAKSGLTESQAIIKVMEMRPQYDLKLAQKIVRFVFDNLSSGG